MRLTRISKLVCGILALALLTIHQASCRPQLVSRLLGPLPAGSPSNRCFSQLATGQTINGCEKASLKHWNRFRLKQVKYRQYEKCRALYQLVDCLSLAACQTCTQTQALTMIHQRADEVRDKAKEWCPSLLQQNVPLKLRVTTCSIAKYDILEALPIGASKLNGTTTDHSLSYHRSVLIGMILLLATVLTIILAMLYFILCKSYECPKPIAAPKETKDGGKDDKKVSAESLPKHTSTRVTQKTVQTHQTKGDPGKASSFLPTLKVAVFETSRATLMTGKTKRTQQQQAHCQLGKSMRKMNTSMGTGKTKKSKANGLHKMKQAGHSKGLLKATEL